ncbi:MAG: hypothetical protein MHM6MM_001719 [Cercozoa sp. M6MM]
MEQRVASLLGVPHLVLRRVAQQTDAYDSALCVLGGSERHSFLLSLLPGLTNDTECKYRVSLVHLHDGEWIDVCEWHARNSARETDEASTAHAERSPTSCLTLATTRAHLMPHAALRTQLSDSQLKQNDGAAASHAVRGGHSCLVFLHKLLGLVGETPSLLTLHDGSKRTVFALLPDQVYFHLERLLNRDDDNAHELANDDTIEGRVINVLHRLLQRQKTCVTLVHKTNLDVSVGQVKSEFIAPPVVTIGETVDLCSEANFDNTRAVNAASGDFNYDDIGDDEEDILETRRLVTLSQQLRLSHEQQHKLFDEILRHDGDLAGQRSTTQTLRQVLHASQQCLLAAHLRHDELRQQRDNLHMYARNALGILRETRTQWRRRVLHWREAALGAQSQVQSLTQVLRNKEAEMQRKAHVASLQEAQLQTLRKQMEHDARVRDARAERLRQELQEAQSRIVELEKQGALAAKVSHSAPHGTDDDKTADGTMNTLNNTVSVNTTRSSGSTRSKRGSKKKQKSKPPEIEPIARVQSRPRRSTRKKPIVDEPNSSDKVDVSSEEHEQDNKDDDNNTENENISNNNDDDKAAEVEETGTQNINNDSDTADESDNDNYKKPRKRPTKSRSKSKAQAPSQSASRQKKRSTKLSSVDESPVPHKKRRRRRASSPDPFSTSRAAPSVARSSAASASVRQQSRHLGSVRQQRILSFTPHKKTVSSSQTSSVGSRRIGVLVGRP